MRFKAFLLSLSFLLVLPVFAQQCVVPDAPGLYFEGRPVIGQIAPFERTGSRLASGFTLGIRARKGNIQIVGKTSGFDVSRHPVFCVKLSEQEVNAGESGGDFVLTRLARHGDRRQLELGAAGAGRASGGVSIKSQLAANISPVRPGVYAIAPARPLKPGEYAFYRVRQNLPPVLYCFTVPKE
jgi:hypothetical protein